MIGGLAVPGIRVSISAACAVQYVGKCHVKVQSGWGLQTV